ACHDVKDMPVLWDSEGVGSILLGLLEVLDGEGGQQALDLLARVVGAVRDGGPGVAVAEELAAEAPARAQAAGDAPPQPLEVLRRAEGEGEARRHEVHRRNLDVLQPPLHNRQPWL